MAVAIYTLSREGDEDKAVPTLPEQERMCRDKVGSRTLRLAASP
jgi:hypothetical protein